MAYPIDIDAMLDECRALLQPQIDKAKAETEQIARGWIADAIRDCWIADARSIGLELGNMAQVGGELTPTVK